MTDSKVIKTVLEPPKVIQTRLSVAQGPAGPSGDGMNAGNGVLIESKNISVDTNVISTKSYAETVANAALVSANAATALVEDLAEINAFKIAQVEDGLDTTNQTVADNFTSLSTSKADQSTLDTLQALVDTKATPADITAALAELIGAAPEALNTVYELAAKLQGDEATINTIMTVLGSCIRFDIPQSLTIPQQDQALANINAEKAGTAAAAVSAITPASIGAATEADGAKARSALQSGDVAPVALSGTFSSLVNKSALFNLVYSAYVIGSNTVILATDTLGEMLGKIQAQINAKEPTIASGTTAQYWRGDKSWRSFAADVLATALTGFSTSIATSVTAADTPLSAIGKLQAQITALAPKTFNQSRWSFTNFDSTTLTGGYVAGGSAGATIGAVTSQMQDGVNGMRYMPLKIAANGDFVKVSPTIGFKLQAGRCCRTVFSIYTDAAQSTLIGFVSSDNIATENNMVAFSIIGLQARAYVINSAGGSTNLGTQNFPSTAVTLPTLTALVADIEYLTDSSVRMVLWNLNTNAKYIDATFSGNGVPALNASGFGGYIPHKAISTAATNYGVELISLGFMGRGIAKPPEIVTPS